MLVKLKQKHIVLVRLYYRNCHKKDCHFPLLHKLPRAIRDEIYEIPYKFIRDNSCLTPDIWYTRWDFGLNTGRIKSSQAPAF